MIVTGDVFTHTWDLARATGQDETLDPDPAPTDDRCHRSDARGGLAGRRNVRAAIEVSADVDDQTRFLAYVGRRM